MGRFGNVLLVGGDDRPLVGRQARRGRSLLPDEHRKHACLQGRLAGARMKLVGGDSGRYEREQFVECRRARAVRAGRRRRPVRQARAPDARAPDTRAHLSPGDHHGERGTGRAGLADRASSRLCARTRNGSPSASGWRRYFDARRTRRSHSWPRWTWACPRGPSSTPALCTRTSSARSRTSVRSAG